MVAKRPEDKWVDIELQSITPDFYHYLNSVWIYRITDRDAYSETVLIHSNVDNGWGHCRRAGHGETHHQVLTAMNFQTISMPIRLFRKDQPPPTNRREGWKEFSDIRGFAGRRKVKILTNKKS